MATDVIDVTRKLMVLDPQILVNRTVTELCGLMEKDERLVNGDSTVDLKAAAATPLIGSSGTIIGVL